MTIFHSSQDCTLYLGDAYDEMKNMSAEIADVIVTSPPYYPVQRDYKLGPAQLGWESHPKEYVYKLVHKYFAEARRLLKDTGSLFVNIGDSYNGDKIGNTNGDASQHSTIGRSKSGFMESQSTLVKHRIEEVQERSLLAIPQLFEVEMIYKAGWCMRNQQLWIKPNAMPKAGVTGKRDPKTGKTIRIPTDRWNVDYEVIPFFVKQGNNHGYYFKEQFEPYESDASNLLARPAFGGPNKRESYGNRTYSGKRWVPNKEKKKIARSILFINTNSKEGGEHKHVAPFPTELVETIIDAACPQGGTVLDIFTGSCSAGEAALKTGRKFIGIDHNQYFLQEALDKRLSKYIGNHRLNF